MDLEEMGGNEKGDLKRHADQNIYSIYGRQKISMTGLEKRRGWVSTSGGHKMGVSNTAWHSVVVSDAVKS